MKSLLRLFLISLIASQSLIICSCGPSGAGEEQSLSPDAKTVKFTVSNIPCNDCEIAIEAALKDVPGIKTAKAFSTLPKNNVVVTYDPKKLTIKDIEKLIIDTGRDITATET